MAFTAKQDAARRGVLFIAVLLGGVHCVAWADNLFLGADDKPLKERLVTHKGDRVEVKFATSCPATVNFAEKERHSRLYEDIHSLLSVLKVTGFAPCQKTFSYPLQHERGNLTITALDEKGAELARTMVVTGPKEHLYLGLDLPVTRSKELKYDSATRTLQPQNTSPQLYLSINWYVGDLLAKQETVSAFRQAFSLDRISFKFFLRPNSKPLDSYGFGVGYQLPKLAVADLSAISIFGARIWNREDAVSSTGAQQTNAATGHAWRFGVTYDIATGVKWLKSN